MSSSNNNHQHSLSLNNNLDWNQKPMNVWQLRLSNQEKRSSSDSPSSPPPISQLSISPPQIIHPSTSINDWPAPSQDLSSHKLKPISHSSTPPPSFSISISSPDPPSSIKDSQKPSPLSKKVNWKPIKANFTHNAPLPTNHPASLRAHRRKDPASRSSASPKKHPPSDSHPPPSNSPQPDPSDKKSRHPIPSNHLDRRRQPTPTHRPHNPELPIAPLPPPPMPMAAFLSPPSPAPPLQLPLPTASLPPLARKPGFIPRISPTIQPPAMELSAGPLNPYHPPAFACPDTHPASASALPHLRNGAHDPLSPRSTALHVNAPQGNVWVNEPLVMSDGSCPVAPVSEDSNRGAAMVLEASLLDPPPPRQPEPTPRSRSHRTGRKSNASDHDGRSAPTKPTVGSPNGTRDHRKSPGGGKHGAGRTGGGKSASGGRTWRNHSGSGGGGSKGWPNGLGTGPRPEDFAPPQPQSQPQPGWVNAPPYPPYPGFPKYGPDARQMPGGAQPPRFFRPGGPAGPFGGFYRGMGVEGGQQQVFGGPGEYGFGGQAGVQVYFAPGQPPQTYYWGPGPAMGVQAQVPVVNHMEQQQALDQQGSGELEVGCQNEGQRVGMDGIDGVVGGSGALVGGSLGRGVSCLPVVTESSVTSSRTPSRLNDHSDHSYNPSPSSYNNNYQTYQARPAPMEEYEFLDSLDPIRFFVLGQSEYYFCEENLKKDIFLRRSMDKEGFVPILTISQFNRIKSLTDSIKLIVEVMRMSRVLEVDEEGIKVRKKDGWEKWIVSGVTPTTITGSGSGRGSVSGGGGGEVGSVKLTDDDGQTGSITTSTPSTSTTTPSTTSTSTNKTTTTTTTTMTTMTRQKSSGIGFGGERLEEEIEEKNEEMKDLKDELVVDNEELNFVDDEKKVEDEDEDGRLDLKETRKTREERLGVKDNSRRNRNELIKTRDDESNVGDGIRKSNESMGIDELRTGMDSLKLNKESGERKCGNWNDEGGWCGNIGGGGGGDGGVGEVKGEVEGEAKDEVEGEGKAKAKGEAKAKGKSKAKVKAQAGNR